MCLHTFPAIAPFQTCFLPMAPVLSLTPKSPHIYGFTPWIIYTQQPQRVSSELTIAKVPKLTLFITDWIHQTHLTTQSPSSSSGTHKPFSPFPALNARPASYSSLELHSRFFCKLHHLQLTRGFLQSLDKAAGFPQDPALQWAHLQLQYGWHISPPFIPAWRHISLWLSSNPWAWVQGTL